MFVRATVLGSVKNELDSARHERVRLELARRELERQERKVIMCLKDPNCKAKLDLVVKDVAKVTVQTDPEFAAEWLVFFLMVVAARECVIYWYSIQ
jgi:hypothetical protein